MLKADFLEWTGGFTPETDEQIATYIRSSMPLDIDDADAAQILQQWMREGESVQIGRDIDQH